MGELVTREALLAKVWGYGEDVRTRTLDVHIRRLRQDLEPYGKMYIETIFGTGYRFQPGPALPLAGARALGTGITPEAGEGAWRFSYPTQ